MSARIWVATRKGLFLIGRGPAGWDIEHAAFLGDNVSLVLDDGRDGTVYAALDLGHFGVKLHRSSDGGRTWEERAAPAYPPKPADAQDVDPVQHKPVPWTVQRIWALEPHGEAAGGLLCGTIPGGLFHSTDGGGSWSLCRGLWDHPGRKEWMGGGADYPGLHSICVHPQDADQILVGVSCGGVWRSADRGASWDVSSHGMWAAYMPPERRDDPVIQDPHRIVQCAAAPDYLWSQHHNGVFRSVDQGRSWREVQAPPASFGFAVAVHPRDPDVAWLVPAQKDEHRVPVQGQVVVSRTRDGGRSFDVLRRGLPQRHAYDIVYRHALDVDGSGDRLALGSTTGSLWVSEDQGDSFGAVSHHLPPIYAVRFAPDVDSPG